MKTDENYRGARHRTLILMYITWLTLSLAPAMVAPPERSFQQGQPELQQSMDNMVNRGTIIHKRTSNPSKDKGEEVNKMKFQEVNFKTSKLLAEAEKVLKTLPDSKERHWVESFVERMREIANMLEETAEHKILSKESDSVKDAPVPDGLPKQPIQPATSAVPENNPFQRTSNMMSKIQMTSPEISRVLPEDDQSEHQAVTKPVALPSKVEETESDELVRELESLHEENIHQTEKSKADIQIPTTTTTSVSLLSKNKQATSVDEEQRKAQYEAKLLKEIQEFHRLYGAMPKEVLDILHADSQKVPESAQNRKINIEEAMKFTESGMKDRRGMLRMDDLNSEHREISMANHRNMPTYAAHHFQYWKFNYTLPNKHPNLVQGFPNQPRHYFQSIPLLNQAQPYQGRPLNVDQNLQKMNPYNQGKYYNVDMLHQPSYNHDALKQKISKPHIHYPGRLPPYEYQNYFMRHNYGPYPYMHNWNPRNSTAHLPQMMQPYANNQAKIDTQLSDEMKRELRDGKIIVLSDSVVRSNFEPDNNEKITTSEKPAIQPMDMKNDTITEN